jgi:hypothetical protein
MAEVVSGIEAGGFCAASGRDIEIVPTQHKSIFPKGILQFPQG